MDFYPRPAIIRKLCPRGGMEKSASTYQLSDHLPLSVQINTDNDADQLRQLIQARKWLSYQSVLGRVHTN